MDLAKSKRELRKKVLERGAVLRDKPLEILRSLGNSPDEEFEIQGYNAWITTWVEVEPSATKVIVQGNLQNRVTRDVELDGFRKNVDGSIIDLPLSELSDWS